MQEFKCMSNHKNAKVAFEQQDVDTSHVLKQSSEGETGQVVQKEEGRASQAILDLT